MVDDIEPRVFSTYKHSGLWKTTRMRDRENGKSVVATKRIAKATTRAG